MTRFSFLAAPILMLGYGVVRLIDGLDGTHGPGPAWTIGHVLFLAALALFGVVLVGLRHAVPRYRPLATAGVVVGLLGLLAFIRGIVIDLIVGFRSADRPAMNKLYPEYDSFPGGLPDGVHDVLMALGPALFVIGMLVLLGLLAAVRPRRLAWWSPVLAAVGFSLITVDLDLLPMGALLVALALAPMVRRPRRHDGTVSAPNGGATPVVATERPR